MTIAYPNIAVPRAIQFKISYSVPKIDRSVVFGRYDFCLKYYRHYKAHNNLHVGLDNKARSTFFAEKALKGTVQVCALSMF